MTKFNKGTFSAKEWANQVSEMKFDDVVSLCEHISRRYGKELTLEQAKKVFDLLNRDSEYDIARASRRDEFRKGTI